MRKYKVYFHFYNNWNNSEDRPIWPVLTWNAPDLKTRIETNGGGFGIGIFWFWFGIGINLLWLHK